MRGLWLVVLLMGCHDVNSIARYDAGDNDVPPFDGGPNFDGGPDVGTDVGPARDAGPVPGDAGPPPIDGGFDSGPGPDAGPPPSAIAAFFMEPFLVRAAVPLGEGILVVGVDNQGDRDTTDSRQGLAMYVGNGGPVADWANHYGSPTVNDQFLVAINNGPDEAVVLGVRGGGGSVTVSRFRAEGLVDTVEFSAVAPFVTDAVFVESTLYASGRSGGDAVIFEIDLGAQTMRTLGSSRSGAFNGIAVHDGTIYTAGQSPVGEGGAGILAVSPLIDPGFTIYSLPDAEFISVAANSEGAVAVGTKGGAGGLHMELRGDSPTVRIATDISRFRQVAFVDGAERYIGLTSNGGSFPFVGERVDDQVRVAFMRFGYITGVSGRLGALQEGGFLVSQNREEAMVNSVHISRFSPLESIPRTACDRARANSSLNEDMVLSAQVSNSTPTMLPTPPTAGTPLDLTINEEELTLDSSCPR